MPQVKLQSPFNLSFDIIGVLGIVNGGTSQSSFTQGDLLYCSATNVLSKLAKGTNGHYLKMGATVPAWAAVDVSVSQGDLNTTTGEVNSTGFSFWETHSLTLPGGEYGFYPQVKVVGGGSSGYATAMIDAAPTGELQWKARTIGSSPNESYTARISLSGERSGGTNNTIYAQQRYITASGHDHWIFLLVAKIDYNGRKKGDLVASYQAPDHPSANQGGATEIEIPHPFGSYDPTKHEIVMVDNADLTIMRQRIIRQKSLLQVINENYFIDDTKRPKYNPREIVKIDEIGDLPGTVIKTMKTPEWAKIMIGTPDFTLKRQMVETLPDNILFKKMRLK